jgi:hypothetical protein
MMASFPKWWTNACDCVNPRANPTSRLFFVNGSTSIVTDRPSDGSIGISDCLPSKNLGVTV